MNNEPTSDPAADSGLILTVSEDKLDVILGVTAEYLSGHEILQETQGLLDARGIKAELKVETLRAAIDEARQNNTGIDNLIIAQGTPPKSPRDARIEWTRDFFATGYRADPKSGTVNFHEMASQPYIEKDEVLVRITLEEPGVEGTDVYGHPIKVRSPKKADLRKGPNVYWDENEKGYRAGIAGRVKLRGTTLEIDEVYSIKGDVGTGTGNVKHPGAVIVSGDVVSEFRIEAGGPVEVRGQVYASEISCEGDLEVKYGINASAEKIISVGGSVKSRHISNAHIICHGDVHAESEIYNSILNVRGQVVCHGRIVGGTTVALGGINVGQAGSETAIKTILVAGVDFELMEALKTKKAEMEHLENEAGKKEGLHKQLKMLGNKLLGGQALQLKELEDFLSDCQERMDAIKREKADIYRKMTEGRTARIAVDKVVYPGTILRIVSSTTEVTEIIRGPLVASYDVEAEQVVLKSRG